MPCGHGRGGIHSDKQEGDGRTPIGAYRLLWLYYRPDRCPPPITGLPCLPLLPRTGWAEDPSDPVYNRPIRHPHDYPTDRMARGDGLYDICAVTDQNFDPVVPGAGSAIFVHLWRKPRHPTAGCISFRARDLCWILRRWTPSSRVVIRAEGGL
ncbi:MAG: L,D-transpeptidase family protein [Pseudomonadota bacterium]